MSRQRDAVGAFMENARRLSENWTTPQPIFNLRTRWTDNYDELFSGSGEILADEKDILTRVVKIGRAILSSRAGDGKTCMLRRLYGYALDRGFAPVMIDLKNWTTDDHPQWRDWTTRDVADGAEYLLQRFSGTRLGVMGLDRLPPSMDKIIFVDGINEISGPVGGQILEVVDALVRHLMRTSAIVADRSVRRELPAGGRWTIGTILPLTSEERTGHGIDATVNAEALASPFFFNTSLHLPKAERDDSLSRSAALCERLKLNDTESLKAGKAAYDAYLNSKSRMFDLDRFRLIAGEKVVRRLKSSSELVLASEGTDNAYFSHHIVHDYLVSRYLISLSPNQWTSEALSVASFEAASFDAIALAFEQMSGEQADLFLRALYDWNLYAAGYALGQVGEAATSASIHMRIVIYAMLAEKKFDAVVATRKRARDALMLIRYPDARPFQKANSFEAVMQALRDVEDDDGWFKVWKSIFLLPSKAKVDLTQLETLRTVDSVIGWTMSNVARRTKVSMRDIEAISAWIDTENATIRWRIVHVLGAYPFDKVIKTLRKLLTDDPDTNVRYGAIRSLIELAVKGHTETRCAVRTVLFELTGKINAEPRVRQELRNSLVIDRSVVPQNWLAFATEVIRTFYAVADGADEQSHWRTCLHNVETECTNAVTRAGA
jgi:HEAT repeats